jgi:hypothetical protein
MRSARSGLLSGVLPAALLAACGKPAGQEALQRGRDAAAPCIERFHDQGHTYAECVRYVAVARTGTGTGADADWQRLGALTQGWFVADLADRQTGDADAGPAARALLAEADALQSRLRVSDATLCALLAQPCEPWLRRREVVRSGHG